LRKPGPMRAGPFNDDGNRRRSSVLICKPGRVCSSVSLFLVWFGFVFMCISFLFVFLCVPSCPLCPLC
jgi:hypothetical protein